MASQIQKENVQYCYTKLDREFEKFLNKSLRQERTKQKLKAHFDPQKNRRYEVYRFRQTNQEDNYNEKDNEDNEATNNVRNICEFADVDFEIEEQIIIGGNSSKIRKRALRDPTFDLNAMLLEGRHAESAYQAKQIESKDLTDGETNKTEQKSSSIVMCRNCGRNYPHTREHVQQKVK